MFNNRDKTCFRMVARLECTFANCGSPKDYDDIVMLIKTCMCVCVCVRTQKETSKEIKTEMITKHFLVEKTRHEAKHFREIACKSRSLDAANYCSASVDMTNRVHGIT